MPNDLKIKFRKANESMKVLAFANITFKGMKIPGFKIAKSKFNNELVAYPPSKKIGYNKYQETVGLLPEDKKYITEEIIKEYKIFKLEGKVKVDKMVKKREYFISSIHLNLLFHFYRFHKNEITEIRLWFIARNILDVKGIGFVDIKELAKLADVKIPYLKMICRKSIQFNGLYKNRLYYKSQNKLMRLHKLYISKGKIRQEKITKKFSKLFTSKKTFEGYVCKCYMENDLDKRFNNKITKGRICYQTMADYFNITRRTAISNIMASDSKKSKNIISYPYYRFKNKGEFTNWMIHNMETVINGHRVEDNPFSYYIGRIDKNNYCLIQHLPNIYKFTGFLLVDARTYKGK